MIRTLLLAGTMAIAAPAIAQTTGTPPAGETPVQTGVPTTTNDHDPTEDNSGTQQVPTIGTTPQVNDGVTSASPGTPSVGLPAEGSTGTMGSPEGTGFDSPALTPAPLEEPADTGDDDDDMETDTVAPQPSTTPGGAL